MKIAEFYKLNRLAPLELYEFVQDLMDDLNKLNYLKKNFTDIETTLKNKKQKLADYWERAKKSKDYNDFRVFLFIAEYKKYSEISQQDPQEALLKAEYLEKKIDYTYEGFLDKKYWNNSALLYIGDYLKKGKAKTLDKAVELLKKEEPGFIHE